MKATGIDLISAGEHGFTGWPLGKYLNVPDTVIGIADAVTKLQTESSASFILVTTGRGLPEPDRLINLLSAEESVDVWYAGNANGKLQWPSTLDFVAPVNYFNMPVPPGIHSPDTADAGFLLVRKAAIGTRGFLDPRFASLQGAIKAWVHRSIYEGILFEPLTLPLRPPTQEMPSIPMVDQLRFIKYRFGQKWLLWTLLRSVSTHVFGISDARAFWKQLRQEAAAPKQPPRDHQGWKSMPLPENAGKVTVLIPTVERYPYIVTVLRLLEAQTITPYEVIVIDQTPLADRKPGLFEGNQRIGLKYFTMDEAGQCRSRNFGLQQSTGDYILFIDDDVEMDADLIEKHLRGMNWFQSDVSAGVADEVGAGPVPADYTFIRLSDVFPTNNCMIRRKVLEASGLFDMAYDRGQRADGDLGARIYKTGARMILNPEIRLLHYHAPRGGLRKHNVRRVTFASSRQFITHFRLPHISELYFSKRHGTLRQQREAKLLTLLGTFSVRGNAVKKMLKVAYATLMIPSFFLTMRKRDKAAELMLTQFPQIPVLHPPEVQPQKAWPSQS